MLIYKVFRPAEWAALQEKGTTSGAPVDVADGYIHFSTATQLAVTLAKHFAGEEELTLLACDANRLGPAIRWEVSRGGLEFPHLYRDLRLDDVLWTRRIMLGPDGHDTGPLA